MTGAVTRPTDQPLILAVEGLCYSGKTTLIAHLAPLINAMALADYSDLAPLPPWPPNDKAAATAALEHFLAIERHRARLARATDAPVILLDRSPLTLIAHEHGMAALGVPGDPAGAIEMYAAAGEKGTILVPHAYLYLAVPAAVASVRQAGRGPVTAHLRHPAVLARIDHVCRTWLHLLPTRRRLLLDGTTTPSVLARRAAAFLTTVGGTPVPSWRALAGGLANRELRCAA